MSEYIMDRCINLITDILKSKWIDLVDRADVSAVSLHSWRSKFSISNWFVNQVSSHFIEYKLN